MEREHFHPHHNRMDQWASSWELQQLYNVSRKHTNQTHLETPSISLFDSIHSWWRIQGLRDPKMTLRSTRRRLSPATASGTGNGEPCGRLWSVLLGTTLWTGCRTPTSIVTRRASADTEPSDLPCKSCTMFSRRWDMHEHKTWKIHSKNKGSLLV